MSASEKLCGHADVPCRMCREMANIPVLQSSELLQGQREVLIVHGNELYRLIRTRNDKLVLQK